MSKLIAVLAQIYYVNMVRIRWRWRGERGYSWLCPVPYSSLWVVAAVNEVLRSSLSRNCKEWHGSKFVI